MVGRIACALALIVMAALPMRAGAQSWPQKPIRLVVPFPAGGPADFFGRGLSNALKTRLDQPVVIDNRSGAGGIAGAENVANAPSDGYSLLIASPGAMVIAPAIAPQQVPYDTMKAFAFITQVVSVPEAVVVTPKLGVKTLQEFVALAKSKPGTLNMASTGSGSMPHLAGELLKREAGIDALHVPYRGAAPAINDLLGGQVDFMFADLPILVPHIQAGKLVGLALGTAQRSSALPDLATTVELGYPKVLADNWYGLFAPAATPPEVQKKLYDVVVAALADPELQAYYAKQGAIARSTPWGEFAGFVKSEGAKWGGLAKDVGAKFE
jgi:tripartite-type tricarboxylate transporter receptor subunit TctC